MPTPLTRDVLIVGGGQAGAHLALDLRKKGFGGSILMVSEEARLPYERPPLSKAYFLGSIEIDRLTLRDAGAWAEQDIEILLGGKVAAIDPAGADARLEDGRTIGFGWCVLATGGKPRRLACPGAELAGVHTLRTVEDVDHIRAALAGARRLAIVGGGYIGLETAAAAREMGIEVTLVEAQGRVLERLTSPVVSRFLQDRHRAHGVDIRLDSQVAAIEGEGRVEAVRLASGERIAADVVIVGIGIEAETRLAEAAGVACDGGVVVDEFGRTSAANVLAIGDCSRYPNPYAGGLRRLESVQHATASAEVAADLIVAAPRAYGELPTFWSDQYDLRLQTAGLTDQADEAVVRGDPESGAFSVVYLKDGRVVAIDAINSPRDFMAARTLIRNGARPRREALADPATPLKSLIGTAAG
jgi:3-phenylpropionate/trans-cinnamate dioxygenase ferredoxin reductase component